MENDLSLEQQFELNQCRNAANKMTKEQALDLLIKAKRLLMIKTNVIRSLGGCKCK